MGLSWWHIFLVLLVAVLLFGTGKISGVMGDLAKGIKGFKREMADDSAEVESDPVIDKKGRQTPANDKIARPKLRA